jgi:beta-glucanase (GH16 family)
MRRLRTAALLVAVVAAVLLPVTVASGQVPSPSPEIQSTAARPVTGPRLLTQNFDGARLNTSFWSPCYWWTTRGCTNIANHELEWYVPDQVKLADGVLRLEARRRAVTGLGQQFNYVSGMMSGLAPEGARFSFLYGYVEARVRVPAGPGLWAALWMLPVTRKSVPEIDILETTGEQPRAAHMHLHYFRDGKEAKRALTWRGTNLSKGWHTIGFDWNPAYLTWYIDGAPRWHITAFGQIPHEPMYLLANLAVGGDFTRPPAPSTPFPASFRIDYVKVWGLPPF